jgi:hypothetical protein
VHAGGRDRPADPADRSGLKGMTVVDFDELKNKAQELAAQHSDTIKQGITKAGDFVGEKVGHDKVDPVQDKLHGLVDKAAGREDPPAPQAPPTTPV